MNTPEQEIPTDVTAAADAVMEEIIVFSHAEQARDYIAYAILAERERAILAERERCAKFIEDTYGSKDETEAYALRATFVVPEVAQGFLQAWHYPSDIADALRNPQ